MSVGELCAASLVYCLNSCDALVDDCGGWPLAGAVVEQGRLGQNTALCVSLRQCTHMC